MADFFKHDTKSTTTKTKKYGTYKTRDGGQQWESQSFRSVPLTEFVEAPKNVKTKDRSKINDTLGKAQVNAFMKFGSKSKAVKEEAKRAVKSGRKHGAGK